jgi:hypothetical protein
MEHDYSLLVGPGGAGLGGLFFPVRFSGRRIVGVSLREVGVGGEGYVEGVLVRQFGLEFEILASIRPVYGLGAIRRLSTPAYERFCRDTGFAHHARFRQSLQSFSGVVAREIDGVSSREARKVARSPPYAPTGPWVRLPPEHGDDLCARATRVVPRRDHNLYDFATKVTKEYTARFDQYNVTISFDADEPE